MKDLRVYWTVRVLLPIALIVSVMLASSGPAGASNVAKNKASVQIGFLGSGTAPSNFQNVLLNIQEVRINPNANAGPGDTKWQTIPVPPGLSGTAGHPGDLQLDLNTAQNYPFLFNSAYVRPDTYVLAELLLDATNPGSLVPPCPSSSSANEGCTSYPIQLENPGNPISVVAPTGSFLVSAKKQSLSVLVLQLKVDIVKVPTVTGGAYTVNVTISELTDPLFATVTGTITTSGGNANNSKKVRKLTVAAETAGTNTVISTAPIFDNSTYTLALPAAGTFGTLYDLTVEGGEASYAATRLPPIIQGQVLANQNFTVKAGQSIGSITGKITDACTGVGISGATLQLFIPPESYPTADCTHLATIGECVSVATANTDNSGNFPLPGTVQVPAAFDSVPILSSADVPPTYSMLVSAPGYDSLITQVNASNKGKGGVCGVPPNTTPCDLSLNTGLISGAFQIVPPQPGETVLVQVMAEDHGTNKIESALPMPIVVRNSSNVVPFTINVPPSVPSFDLFETTIDLYQGVSDPYQGHSIEVISDVPSPGEPTVAGCATTSIVSPHTITCVGHGSINGRVTNANLGTSVVLSKTDLNNIDHANVRITSTPVQNVIQDPSNSTQTTNSYNFCVPADTYNVTRFQVPQQPTPLAPTATPTPIPVAPPVRVTVPPPPIVGTPGPTPTPSIKCPTNCFQADGTCPGICKSVVPDPL